MRRASWPLANGSTGVDQGSVSPGSPSTDDKKQEHDTTTTGARGFTPGPDLATALVAVALAGVAAGRRGHREE